MADKDDVNKDQRKTFAAKGATGEWDGVVISHTSFERIGVSAEAQARFLAAQIDEAHAHKNLAFPSHIQGVSGTGSMRAEDMALKLHSLRERHGARVATFATAIPIANSVAEIYVMQRYLQPRLPGRDWDLLV